MPVLLELVKQIHESQKALEAKVTTHMTDETNALAIAITKLMKDAFPEGDPDGHRRHHELVIQREEEKAKFWQEMRIAAGKWAGIGVLGFLAMLVWTGAHTKLLIFLAGATPPGPGGKP
jgi:hypothetical protein